MKKFIALCCIFLICGCVAQKYGLKGEENQSTKCVIGNVYYTQTNIWYLNKNKIVSKNVHQGAMIPVGTKVKIKQCKGCKIVFVDNQENVYTMILARRSVIDLNEHFDRYFGKENPMEVSGKFYKFTQQEQDSIKSGIIDYGMCKEAVLMAYGYPPPTYSWVPDLKSNAWRYINDGFRLVAVYFRDEVIYKIEDVMLGLKTPVGRRETVVDRKEKNVSLVADEISKLKKLMDDGAITKEEFEAKKKQLLGV